MVSFSISRPFGPSRARPRPAQVHDLVFSVTANELAQENKYKELLRGPDHQERTINSNYNRWNPCVTAEVSVDVTNDGKHWSSDLTSAYALLVEPTEKYINQKTHPQKHFVPGTWAVSNFKRPSIWGLSGCV